MLIEQVGKVKEVTLHDIYPDDFTEILLLRILWTII
jgi:hypothetical protein